MFQYRLRWATRKRYTHQMTRRGGLAQLRPDYVKNTRIIRREARHHSPVVAPDQELGYGLVNLLFENVINTVSIRGKENRLAVRRPGERIISPVIKRQPLRRAESRTACV